MIMSLVLFENEFLNIVAISFTALIVNELIMVALEITTWCTQFIFMIRPGPELTRRLQARLHDYCGSCDATTIRAKHGLSSSIFRSVHTLFYSSIAPSDDNISSRSRVCFIR
jgi:hypothetical protein